ncbi:MAG: hydrogenase 4 subunit D [Methylocella sp.]
MMQILIAGVALPFLGAAMTLLLPQRPSRYVCLASAVLSFFAILAALVQFVLDGRHEFTQPLVSVDGVVLLGFTVDNLSLLIASAVSLVGLLVCLYSLSYMSMANKEHPDTGRSRYFFFMQVFVGAMAGLVFSSTLTGELFFFEITGVCSWGLIGYYETPKALNGAAKALVVTHIASLGLYFAAAILFANTGSFSLSALSAVSAPAKTAIMLGILFAAWGKSAQFPLHTWLPGAMEAPTPVSAYLHAGSMVNIGVYIFARAIQSAGQTPHVVGVIGVVAASVTLIYAFAMYFPQKDIKRLLVYSTIAQLSYIFLALSLSIFGSPLAFKGGVAHIFNHAFAKSLFFLVSGALSFTLGTRMMPLLRGLLTHLPLVGVAFGVAALAIGGAPPMNLFFSKFAIFAGGFEAARLFPLLLIPVLIAIAESVGTFAWFLKKFGFAAFGEPSPTVAAATPLPLGMKVALAALIVLTLCSGFVAPAWLG